jgi:hypothetical protein
VTRALQLCLFFAAAEVVTVCAAKKHADEQLAGADNR